MVDVIVPISFNFPHLGKLLSLLFILFGAWFTETHLEGLDYLAFASSGLISFFGGVTIAIPYLMDMFQIPTDLFQLFMVTGILNSRFATLTAAMHLLIFTLLTTCAMTGVLRIQVRKAASRALITAVLVLGVVICIRGYLAYSLEGAYQKDQVIADMQLLLNPSPAVVHREVPPARPTLDPQQSRVERIRESGILRVGYHPDNLPFSYFNQAGDLVGFDVDMAHLLAEELDCKLEFVPLQFETMAQQLKDDHFDLIMSGIGVTTPRLEAMSFSDPYLEVTLAVVVRDHRRSEFATLEAIQKIEGLRISVVSQDYFASKIKALVPTVEVFPLSSVREFFESQSGQLDALLTSAEAGSAWTLLYPQFTVVVPQPDVSVQPVAYPIAGHDPELESFISHWVKLKQGGLQFRQLYNHWILGQKPPGKEEPRWSIIRNVLHWVD